MAERGTTDEGRSRKINWWFWFFASWALFIVTIVVWALYSEPVMSWRPEPGAARPSPQEYNELTLFLGSCACGISCVGVFVASLGVVFQSIVARRKDESESKT